MGGSTSEEYSKVVSAASLEDILLTSSTFKASLEYSAANAADDVDRAMFSKADGFHCEAGLLVGEVKCSVAIKKKGADLELFSVNAIYAVVFNVPGAHSEAALNAFFERIATFAVWPYFRSHVAVLASAANVDVPVLPIKKLLQKVETVDSYVEPDENDRSGK